MTHIINMGIWEIVSKAAVIFCELLILVPLSHSQIQQTWWSSVYHPGISRLTPAHDKCSPPIKPHPYQYLPYFLHAAILQSFLSKMRSVPTRLVTTLGVGDKKGLGRGTRAWTNYTRLVSTLHILKQQSCVWPICKITAASLPFLYPSEFDDNWMVDWTTFLQSLTRLYVMRWKPRVLTARESYCCKIDWLWCTVFFEI